MFGVDVPTSMPRLSTARLWEKARRVAHRTWATVPRDRSREIIRVRAQITLILENSAL
mgnify:CR=1 FL=1